MQMVRAVPETIFPSIRQVGPESERGDVVTVVPVPVGHHPKSVGADVRRLIGAEKSTGLRTNDSISSTAQQATHQLSAVEVMKGPPPRT